MGQLGIGQTAAVAAVMAAAGAFSCLATRALIPVLRRRQVLDRPNARSSHAAPIPRGGGVAPVGAVLLAWAGLAWPGLAQAGLASPALACVVLGAVVVAVVSWIDDLRGLSPAARLPAHCAAVAIGVAALPALPGPAQGPLALALLAALGLVWVWWVNLFNFMDGIDGIAGSEAAAIGAGLMLFAGVGAGVDFATALLAAAVLGAATGFLVWNWAPARIFLGDVGSVPLGYLTGWLLMSAAVRGHWRIALILPLYFLADATVTLCRRLLRGERVWQAHREHFYQRAVQRGLSHAAVVRRVIAADLVLIGCGWAAENGAGAVPLGLAAATVAILLAALAHGRVRR